jgi:hypothetical protein
MKTCKRCLVFFPAINKELKKRGVTSLLLWEEYKRHHPDGVGKSQLKHYFPSESSGESMNIELKAGDKLHVDFAGDKLSIIDLAAFNENIQVVSVSIMPDP